MDFEDWSVNLIGVLDSIARDEEEAHVGIIFLQYWHWIPIAANGVCKKMYSPAEESLAAFATLMVSRAYHN